jgi:hypothetical protein
MPGLTSSEVRDIRIERVLSYIGNPVGQSLDGLLVTIDSLLKYASPDAMSPGLINWEHKDLFLEKWLTQSGTGIVSYNAIGASKIGKGRYEITGNGRFVYDRFLPISEIRGVTGRIFMGQNGVTAQVTVGAQCYDANKNLIGDNGGFLFHNYILPQSYTFTKSSAFGEATSGTRLLKPSTRFVKLFIDVTNNDGGLFFDESELTTFELDERYLQIFDTTVDWNRAEFFYTEPIADTTFTFSNALDGRVKNIIIKNTNLTNLTVNFPSAKWQGGVPLTIIRPGRTSIFTFIKAAGVLYGSVIEELE